MLQDYIITLVKLINKDNSEGYLQFLSETLNFNFLCDLLKQLVLAKHSEDLLQSLLQLFEVLSFHDTLEFLMWAQKL